MNPLKIVMLFIYLNLATAKKHTRQKRDVRSLINDSLNLFYYGQNFKMPIITLNTAVSAVCNISGTGMGYYLQDIIGQADNITNIRDCLSGCMNLPDCVAINYVPSLKQCVALRSGTNDSANLLLDDEELVSYHFIFNDCKSKISKFSPKQPAGDPPTSCGLPFFQQNILSGINTRIIGGTEANPYSYPWIGRIMLDYGKGPEFICGCSLIMGSSNTESDLVITAAHCILDFSDNKKKYDVTKFTLRFADHDSRFLEPQEQTFRVKYITFYPDYIKNLYTNVHKGDIALMKLKTPIKFNNYIRPICLPNAGQIPKDKTKSVAAGYGRYSKYNDSLPPRLRQIIQPVQEDKICSNISVWGDYYVFDNDTMTCAGTLGDTSNICNGDSGGPLAFFEDGRWTLFGISSFVYSYLCAYPNKPGVFTKVSAYRAWIDKTIEELNKI